MTFTELKKEWFLESDLIIKANESQIEKLKNFLDENDYVNTVDERLYNINEEASYLLASFLKYG
jgi:hypothetical protein|tara:strand:- start:322 stop:513 length:192 start_codon:yes stop_codon:yes gene_type:complete